MVSKVRKVVMNGARESRLKDSRGDHDKIRSFSLKQAQAMSDRFVVSKCMVLSVSGQNAIGIYIIPLALIQHTAQKQNTVCDNQLLKLQPAVTNKMLYLTTGC